MSAPSNHQGPAADAGTDNTMLAAFDQLGAPLVNAVFRPKTRRREREVRERAMEMLEVFNLTRSRTTTPAPCPAASSSCSSSRP